MRRHGWQLPYHPLQLVAIAVFLSLGFAFFVFFVPFVGSHSMKIIITSVYAPLMALVFGSYICCAACDPADPAVLQKRNPNHHHHGGSTASWITSSSACFTGEKGRIGTQASPNVEEGRREEDMLFCSLCEVEILKCSKHCRVCDKCVDSFDHHCRWLNNCIGKRNYRIFIVLMVSGFLMLVVQWAIGVWVIARCFLERQRVEADVSAKLGSIFSLVSFLCVVAVCTVIAAFATLPVGQLCLFHALLIQKGISTYDYILAMREQEQQQYGGSERLQSPYMSPASSVTTTMSGGISVSALNRRPWCTPPRMFVDHEQTAGHVDRTKNIHSDPPPKTNSAAETREKRVPVKISPWALARLNPEDAFRAAAEARKNSSVLQSVQKKKDFGVIAETETDSSSSSDESSLRNEQLAPSISSSLGSKAQVPWPARGKLPSSNNVFQVVQNHSRAPSQAAVYEIPVQNHAREASYDMQSLRASATQSSSASALVPLQMEARNAFCGIPISRSTSSSRNSAASLDAPVTDVYNGDLAAASSGNSWLGRSRGNNGYETSGGETADDSDGRFYNRNLFYNALAQKKDMVNSTNPLILNGLSPVAKTTIAVASAEEASRQQKLQHRRDALIHHRYYEMVVPDLSKSSFGAPSYYDLSSSETDHHTL